MPEQCMLVTSDEALLILEMAVESDSSDEKVKQLKHKLRTFLQKAEETEDE